MDEFEEIKIVLLTVADLISDEWVTEIWNKEFIDVDPTTDAIKESLLSNDKLADILVQLHNVLLPWTQQQLSLQQSYRAFKVGNADVFDRAVKMFKALHCIGNNVGKKRNINKQTKKPTKRQKRQIEHVTDDNISNDEENGESCGDEMELHVADIKRLHTSCVGLLKDFVHLLRSNPRLDSNDMVVSVISILIELCRVDTTDFSGFDSCYDGIDEVDCIPHLAFVGLRILCHTQQLDIINQILKLLIPNILLVDQEASGPTNTQTVSLANNAVKEQTVRLICWLLKDIVIEGLAKSVVVFIQHICKKVPERSEYRIKIAQAIVRILKELPISYFSQAVQWIITYSKNIKINYRIFGLDIISLLLDSGDRCDEISLDTGHVSRQCLLESIVERCSDIAASVRTRALLAFEQCASSQNTLLTNMIKAIVTPMPGERPLPPRMLIRTPQNIPQTTNIDVSDRDCRDNESFVEDHADVQGNTIALAPNANISLPDNTGIVSMVRRRCSDEKVNVRKAAVQVLEKIVRLEVVHHSQSNVVVIKDRCRDPAVSVRKQALQSLTDLLLDHPTQNIIMKAWLDGVLPLVLDSEAGVQSKCVELICSTLFDNVVAYHQTKTVSHHLAWHLLALIANDVNSNSQRCFQKVCDFYGKTGKFSSQLVSILKTHISTENNSGVWLFFSCVVSYLKKFNADFICDYWKKCLQQTPDADDATVIRVLTTLSKVPDSLTAFNKTYLIDALKTSVVKFNSSPDVVSAVVQTLYSMTKENSSNEEWFGEVLKICDSFLSKVILCDEPDMHVDEDLVVRHLFTLGEISQLYPRMIPNRVFMLVQSVIAAPVITTIDGSSQRGFSQGLSQQPVLSQFRGSNMSPRIRSFAYLTLGKLCLQNEQIAKTCVPALARELEVSVDPAIRNNVIVVLCDLCIRYTSLIDSYVPCVASCLQDQCPLIRYQTLTLLTNLLQEDYLKWKGSLLYRFLICIVDKDDHIRQHAQFCLVHLLLQRAPSLFFNHFVESLFYFNGCDSHAVYNKFSEAEHDKQLFSLKGLSSSSSRMIIYKVMLEHMTDEQRFQIMGKLVQEVLAWIVDELVPLDAVSSSVLQDALSCLACKEIKLSALRTKPNDDYVETDQEMATAMLNAAKKTLISQIMKKTFAENTVPILVSLKHLLERHHSAILRDFMICLRELMKDYKNEVKDILSADKQLANEIEFDLRKLDNNTEQIQPLATNNVHAQRTPGAVLSVDQVAALQLTPTASPKSPRQSLINNAGAQPARRVSVSTIAIINSARKAMERTKLNSSSCSTPHAVAYGDDRVTNTVGRAVMAKHSDSRLRAVSTPAVRLRDLDITFANNVSLINLSD